MLHAMQPFFRPWEKLQRDSEKGSGPGIITPTFSAETADRYLDIFV